MEDHEGAVADFTKTIERGPVNADAFFNRGTSRSKINDLDGAIADFTKVIELKSGDAQSYYSRGLIKLIKGQKEGGCSDLRTARKLGYLMAVEALTEYCQ